MLLFQQPTLVCHLVRDNSSLLFDVDLMQLSLEAADKHKPIAEKEEEEDDDDADAIIAPPTDHVKHNNPEEMIKNEDKKCETVMRHQDDGGDDVAATTTLHCYRLYDRPGNVKALDKRADQLPYSRLHLQRYVRACTQLQVITMNERWAFVSLHTRNQIRIYMKLWSVVPVMAQVQRLVREISWKVGDAMKVDALGTTVANAIMQALWPVDSVTAKRRCQAKHNNNNNNNNINAAATTTCTGSVVYLLNS